ncbi:hypothetical protein DSM104443_02873 [Usitatibacter rugosus]|uniref:Uncharacterized protein n=1 Tax=Usitatibacter rugosus TaxID=2732067 RepID=A0A6M4GWZ2_9PROT|nr:hypothetical protein [Usitatibacter rugosus]QJR11790.1 hypothetical protein DSM104443_02873 [Usitatibacter rugosus]
MIPTLALSLGLYVSIVAWGAWRLRRFLRAHPVIATPADLVAYRALAASNMIGALVLMALVAVIVAWFALYVLSDGPGFAFFLTVAGVVLSVTSALFKPLENRARYIDCMNAELYAEQQHIADVWFRRVWPNFDGPRKPLPDAAARMAHWLTVEHDASGIHLRAWPPGNAPWTQAIAWTEIRRVCLRTVGPLGSDEFHLHTSLRAAPFVVPTEAGGAEETWGVILERRLFPAERAIEMMSSPEEKTQCWPEEVTA